MEVAGAGEGLGDTVEAGREIGAVRAAGAEDGESGAGTEGTAWGAGDQTRTPISSSMARCRGSSSMGIHGHKTTS